MKKIFLILLLGIFMISFASANIIYDEIDDSSINGSLWGTSTSGDDTNTVTEDNLNLKAYSFDLGVAIETAEYYATAIDYNDLYILNLTAELDINRRGDSSGVANSKLFIFGNLIKGLTGTGSFTPLNDNSLWYLIRNSSVPSTFDVYDDGVFSQSITPTDNYINITTYADDQVSVGGRWTSATGNISYVYYDVVDVILNSPTDSLISLPGESVIFNSTGFSSPGYVLSNMTLYINDILNETKSLSGTEDTETFNKSFSNIGDYNWSVIVCNNESLCSTSETRDFSIEDVIVNTNNFNNPVLEGTTESFSANFSVNPTLQLTNVILYYNGTQYTTTTNEYQPDKYFTNTQITIPQVDTETNVTFYWNLTLDDGSSFISDSNNQTIETLELDNCSSGDNLLFNFTMYDEDSLNLLSGSDNTSVKIEFILSNLANSLELVTFSQTYNQTSSSSVCALNNLTSSSYRVDGIIEYTSSSRFVEFYHIENYTLNNATDEQNISLYNLLESRGQEFKITYKDDSFTPVQNVIIQLQRKYVDEGLSRVIEIPKAGQNGITIGHLIPNDVIYTLVFLKEGQILDTFSNVVAICQNPSITDCEINLNSFISSDDLISLVEENDFFSTLQYDADTSTVSSVFGITSGVSGDVVLNVTKQDSLGTTLVCSDTITGAGGTLSCVVPSSFDNSTIYASLTLDGEIRREGFINLNPTPQEQYGGALIFLGLIMMLFLVGIGISDNPTLMGAMLIIGSIILVSLNIIYSASWIGVGASILWFIIAVAVVLIKGGQKR